MKKIFKNKNERPIAYYPKYKVIVGSTSAAVMLSQLMYWFSKKNKIYKTDNEIMKETRLTQREVRTAKAKIKKLHFIKVTLEGIPPKTFYELDEEKLINIITEIEKNDQAKLHKNTSKDKANRTSNIVQNDQPNTQTTSDITIETTTSNSFENFEDWLIEKSKKARNKEAYKAVIRKKYKEGEKSVIDEFKRWLEDKRKQKEEEKLILLQNREILLDRIYHIVGVEKEENKYIVHLKESYKNRHRINFKNLEEIEKRVKNE